MNKISTTIYFIDPATFHSGNVVMDIQQAKKLLDYLTSPGVQAGPRYIELDLGFKMGSVVLSPESRDMTIMTLERALASSVPTRELTLEEAIGKTSPATVQGEVTKHSPKFFGDVSLE